MVNPIRRAAAVARARGAGRRAAQLFSAEHYRSQFAPGPAPTGDLLDHFLRIGAWRGLDPHPLFDTRFYLDRSPDVVAAGINPLVHYLDAGAREGRDPHLLFETGFYREQCTDDDAAQNPVLHYLSAGAAAGLSPHPLLDGALVAAQRPGSARTPLETYLDDPHDIDPNPWFDSAFYLERHLELRASGVAPLAHYVEVGAVLGEDPHPLFDASFYAEQHPDIPPARLLEHHLRVGSAAGAPTNPAQVATRDTPTSCDPALPRHVRPFRVVTADDPSPRLTVLLPNLSVHALTGGPNTALRLAGLVAEQGIDLRLVSTDYPLEDDWRPLVEHCASLVGADRLTNVTVVDGRARSKGLDVRPDETFLATSWWTAQVAHAACRSAGIARFVYLVQDFEPYFYPASTEHALALETYGFPHVPIVNSQLLLEYLAAEQVGRYADPSFVREATAFDAVPDPAIFHPVPRRPGRPRRAVLYARPSVPRNLYELGLAALRRAAVLGAFDDEPWEFATIGDDVPRASLDATRVIEPLGWPALDEWGRILRESDVLLSLVWSAHPSYPPIEMAACGGLVVTNAFGPKDTASLARYGSTLIAVPPGVEDLADAIVGAVARLPEVDRARADGSPAQAGASPTAPLEPAARRIVELLRP